MIKTITFEQCWNDLRSLNRVQELEDQNGHYTIARSNDTECKIGCIVSENGSRFDLHSDYGSAKMKTPSPASWYGSVIFNDNGTCTLIIPNATAQDFMKGIHSSDEGDIDIYQVDLQTLVSVDQKDCKSFPYWELMGALLTILS